MARILIVYGTTEGHTTTIVQAMRDAIEARGHEVDVRRAGTDVLEIPPEADGVIVGASVHKEKHQAEIRHFASEHCDRLGQLPSAFFQVCLTAADPGAEAEQATRQLVEDFSRETGWRPATVETFAGMLAWTQYDFFTRLLMKLILKRMHRPEEELDTSHDIDFTDYEAVERFGERFADSVAAVAA